MLAAMEFRLGAALKAPEKIELLIDNGSSYITERTRVLAAGL